jgi:hypothetical protein
MDHDDEAAILAEIRDRLAEHGEPAEDYTDDELRAALRFTLVALAHEYAPAEGQGRLSLF